MKTMKHILLFLGLLFVMYCLTFIPFGIYLNTALTIYGLWKVADI